MMGYDLRSRYFNLKILDSDVRNKVSSTDAIGVDCLADVPKYKSLERRRRFLLQYWYALATVPFFLSIVIGVGVFPRLVPDTAFWEKVAIALIYCALGWSFVVIFYFSFVFCSLVPRPLPQMRLALRYRRSMRLLRPSENQWRCKTDDSVL